MPSDGRAQDGPKRSASRNMPTSTARSVRSLSASISNSAEVRICSRSIDDHQSHGCSDQNRIHEYAKDGDEDITGSLICLDIAS